HRLLTVLENLMLVPLGQLGEGFWNVWFRPQAVRAQEEAIRQRALEVLDFVELLHLKDEYAGNLSGGQRKLLELARVLMAEPKMVLLDEPGAGVNPTLMKKLAEKILELNQKGLTFLIIEHDMDLVMRLCDPIVVLSEGSVLKEGSPEAVRRDPKVLEAYLGGQYGAFEG
ncbi:MAG: ATP-binding cassette domain-containing protein, partial [Candidatus Caldarchaeum sp.]